MKIPKYWAKSVQVVPQPGGRTLKLACWQWSDISIDQAQQKAVDRARELAQKVLAGAQLNRYGYSERPLRDEITQALTNRAGHETAVVTRNLYGALVLNTANAMFIDIDFAEKNASGSLAGQLGRMLGGRSPGPDEPYVQRISTWASRHPDLSLRIYRTFAGLRCLITNQLFDPGQAESVDILQALGSDPLYIRLCQAQACFRARLTPKPWRSGMGTPPVRYPFESAAVETRYREWEQRYGQTVAPYSVCKFVKQIGRSEAHPDIEPILSLHDQMTGTQNERQLA